MNHIMSRHPRTKNKRAWTGEAKMLTAPFAFCFPVLSCVRLDIYAYIEFCRPVHIPPYHHSREKIKENGQRLSMVSGDLLVILSL